MRAGSALSNFVGLTRKEHRPDECGSYIHEQVFEWMSIEGSHTSGLSKLVMLLVDEPVDIAVVQSAMRPVKPRVE